MKLPSLIRLIVKLIVCTTVVWFSDFVLPGLNYISRNHILFIGLFLGMTSQIMDLIMAREKMLWISTGADFLAAAVILYLSQFVMWGSRVTVSGVLLTAAVLAVTEYLQHLYFLRYGGEAKTE